MLGNILSCHLNNTVSLPAQKIVNLMECNFIQHYCVRLPIVVPFDCAQRQVAKDKKWILAIFFQLTC